MRLFIICYCILSFVGQDFYPTSFSSRSVLAFWWIFTVVIMAAHTGSFSSFLFGTGARSTFHSSPFVITGDLTAFLAINNDFNEIKTLDEFGSQSEISLLVLANSSAELNLRVCFEKS